MRIGTTFFAFPLLLALPIALLLSGCATNGAGAARTGKAYVDAVMTINAKSMPLKYAYAMHRPIMLGDKKRLGKHDDFELQPGDVGLVVLTNGKLSSTQLDDIRSGHYAGSNKIRGIVLTFAVAKPKIYESTFLTEYGALYLYGYTSNGGEITVLETDSGRSSASGSGVSGQVLFNNQDATGTHAYQVRFNLPWTTLDERNPAPTN